MLFAMIGNHIRSYQSIKHIPDARDSAPFTSIFLVLGFAYSQVESTPAYLRLRQAIRLARCKVQNSAYVQRVSQ